MRKLKARLRKALRRKKECDRLKILAEVSLAHQRNLWGILVPNLGKFWLNFFVLKF